MRGTNQQTTQQTTQPASGEQTTQPASGEQTTQQTTQQTTSGEQTTQTTSGEQTTQQTTQPTPDATQQQQQSGTQSGDDSAQDVRPVAKPEDYVLPQGVPAEISKFAFENGFSQKALDNTLKLFNDVVTANAASEQTAIRSAGEQFVKSWGDQASTNKQIVKSALAQVDPKGQLTDLLTKTGFINHPLVLNHLLEVGRKFQEGGFLQSLSTPPKAQKSLSQKLFGGNQK